jgi:hypothetical protein
MKYIYQLSARGNYFKMVVTSRTEAKTDNTTGTDIQTDETFVAMYDFPIKQCYARGIYINTDGMVTQRGLVFLCAFPGKTLNIMENTTTIDPDGKPTEVPNDFYFNGDQLSFNMFFETILMNTGL